MSILSKNSLNISDNSELIHKAGKVYSKDSRDISRIIDYIYSQKNRTILVSKEVSGYMNQGFVEVVNSIKINAGHSSYHFINDQLNYRFDAKSPCIILAENLNKDLAMEVLKLSEKDDKIIFISKNVNKKVEDFLLSCKEKYGLTISLVNLSEEKSKSEGTFEFLKANLKSMKNLDEVPSEHEYFVKTSKRVVMENDFTYFIDPPMGKDSETDHLEMYQELVEVHLKSHDETWSHALKSNLVEADSYMRDSLSHGILPNMNTSFDLANQKLKEYYSENDDIQRGMEIVQNAIDSFIIAVKEDVIDEKCSSLSEALEKSLKDLTFIPETKAAKVVTDIWAICLHLLSREQD